jgi:hypothetical protein
MTSLTTQRSCILIVDFSTQEVSSPSINFRRRYTTHIGI